MSDPRPSREARRVEARTVFVVASAVIFAAVLVVAHAVMLPFLLALIVAYVATPSVTRLERRGGEGGRARMPRWAAILLVYALTLGGMAGFTALVVPRLVAEGRTAKAELPHLQRRLREEVLPELDRRIQGWTGSETPPPAAGPDDEDERPQPAPVRVTPREGGGWSVDVEPDVRLREVSEGTWQLERVERGKAFSTGAALQRAFDKGAEYLRANAFEVVRVGREVLGALSRGIFFFFLTLMLAAYLMLTRERIFAFVRGMVVRPGDARAGESWERFLERLDRGLSGVVRGQLLICLVNGVLSAIGFWLFGLKYWPILALVAGAMSLIPIFGSILSSVPAVAIGLTQSPTTGFAVLAWIVGIHQLEANFLNPKIIGDAAKIHPVLVVFSLLVGEHFLSITGALLAVPTLSIAQTVFLHVRSGVLGEAEREVPVPGPDRPQNRRKTDVDRTLRSAEERKGEE